MTDKATHQAPAGRPEERDDRLEERPGTLRGGATLTLQTRQAQRLVKGRGYRADRPAIIGLIGFANLVRTVWHGARADDPYADWWMLKVHDALEQATEELAATASLVATRFQASGPLEVDSPAADKPARVALNFSNAYAFQAARLVGNYDDLARAVLSARHVGLVTRAEAEQLLHRGGRVVRHALQSPVGYRLLGVTREDLKQGTAKALQAHEMMGGVPAEVLSGEHRAPHAPAIVVRSPSPTSNPTGLRSLPSLG